MSVLCVVIVPALLSTRLGDISANDKLKILKGGVCFGLRLI